MDHLEADRVLVLEDDHEFAKCLQLSLEDEGYDVTLTSTADDALRFLETNVVDAIVADIFIKVGDKIVPDGGVRLISQLKQIQNKKIPVIAMSGSFNSEAGRQVRLTAKVVGARATLAKPFHPEELLDALHELISSARGNRTMTLSNA